MILLVYPVNHINFTLIQKNLYWTLYHLFKQTMKYITYATHSERYFPALKASYEYFDCDYEILGFGVKWIDYKQKLEGIINYAKTQKPDEIICVMDGFDTIVTASPDEFVTRFKNSGKDLIYSADCWKTPMYRFMWKNRTRLNCGLFVGYARTIIEFLTPILEEGIKSDARFFNDQLNVGKRFESLNSHQKKKWVVDLHDEIFSNTDDCVHFRNTNPVCVGSPGGGNLLHIINEIGLPISLTPTDLQAVLTATDKASMGEIDHAFESFALLGVTCFLFLALAITVIVTSLVKWKTKTNTLSWILFLITVTCTLVPALLWTPDSTSPLLPVQWGRVLMWIVAILFFALAWMQLYQKQRKRYALHLGISITPLLLIIWNMTLNGAGLDILSAYLIKGIIASLAVDAALIASCSHHPEWALAIAPLIGVAFLENRLNDTLSVTVYNQHQTRIFNPL